MVKIGENLLTKLKITWQLIAQKVHFNSKKECLHILMSINCLGFISFAFCIIKIQISFWLEQLHS